MSLRGSPRAASAGDVPVAVDFQKRFIRDAHRLLAEGFARLDRETLGDKTEEAISGDIVNGINDWFDEPATPAWTRNYFAKPEIPLQTRDRQGKDRPRIDIFVESSEPRPRARFAFEAKRLYRSDSVAAYVGTKGLGAFLDGTHEVDGSAAGMLGYVQNDGTDANVERIRRKLDSERAAHNLTQRGPVWKPISLDPRLGNTWVSRHSRKSPRATIDIYHSFLQCCG